MSKKLHLLILFIFCQFLVVRSIFAELGTEHIGEYYVQIGLVNDVLGKGIDQVFNVHLRYLHPQTENDVNLLKKFKYYDGVKYRWRETQGEWRLYKYEPGQPVERIRLIGMMFPPNKEAKYHLELFNANMGVYNRYNLKDNLKYLAILGLTTAGDKETVDFINEYVPKNPDDSTIAQEVILSNADVAFKRYAHSQGWAGINFSYVNKEGETLDKSFIDSAEQYNKYWFDEIRIVNSEQEIIDQYLNNPNENLILNDIHRKIPNTIGDCSDLTLMKIRYIYKPVRAKTDTPYGSPRAAFFPVRMEDWNDGNPQTFYPIFIFPAAFSSLANLQRAVIRELFHAQYWNTLGTLDTGQIDCDDGTYTYQIQGDRVRELLARTSAVHLEGDIYYASRQLSVQGMSDVSNYFNTLFHLSMDQVFKEHIENVINNPFAINHPVKLPWTISTDLIMLPDIHTAADIFYNNAVLKRATKLNSALATSRGYTYSFMSILKSGFKGTKSPQGLSPAFREIPLVNISSLNYKLDTWADKRSDYRKLLKAIAFGYTGVKADRNQGVSQKVQDLKYKINDWLSGEPEAETLNFQLLDAIATDGWFLKNDLAWLVHTSEYLTLGNLVRTGLSNLISVAWWGTTGIKNLYPPNSENYLVNRINSPGNLERTLTEFYRVATLKSESDKAKAKIILKAKENTSGYKLAKQTYDQTLQEISKIEQSIEKTKADVALKRKDIDDKNELKFKAVRVAQKLGKDLLWCEKGFIQGCNADTLHSQLQAQKQVIDTAEVNLTQAEKDLLSKVAEYENLEIRLNQLSGSTDLKMAKMKANLKKALSNVSWPRYVESELMKYFIKVENNNNRPARDVKNFRTQIVQFEDASNPVIQFIDTNPGYTP